MRSRSLSECLVNTRVRSRPGTWRCPTAAPSRLLLLLLHQLPSNLSVCTHTHAHTHTHTHTHTTFVTSLFRNTLTVVVFPPEILLSVDESLNAFSWSEIRFLSPGGATFSFVAPQNKIKLQLSVISNQRLKLFCSCYHALILLIYFV